jgi:hypothetical protein
MKTFVRIKSVAFAVLLVVLAAFGASADEAAREMKVSVRPETPVDSSVLVPVAFRAPFQASNLARGTTQYLVDSSGGIHACQITLIEEIPGRPSWWWAEARAVMPLAETECGFLVTRSDIRPEIPLVGVVVAGDVTTLDAGKTRLIADAARFCIANNIVVGEWQALPAHIENLANPQQSVRLVVTDTFRHADFVLSARVAENGVEVASRGPAVASVKYTGVFKGEQGIDEVPFTAEVSLNAAGMIEATVRFDPETFDRELYRLQSVEFAMPFLFPGSTGVAFGGRSGASIEGEGAWEGSSLLAISPGAYEFRDVDAVPILGSGEVAWIRYGDENGGVIFFPPGEGGGMVFRVVDYSSDFLSMAVIPVETDGVIEASLRFACRLGGLDAGALDREAAALCNPPGVVVDLEYLESVRAAGAPASR